MLSFAVSGAPPERTCESRAAEIEGAPHRVHRRGVEAVRAFRESAFGPTVDAIAPMETASLEVLDNLERMAVASSSDHGAVGADPDQDCGVLSPPGFFHSFQNRLSRSLAGDNADWVDGEIGRSRLSNWSGSANA